MKLRVYVAGPMTGYPLFNWPIFEATTRVLRRMGWDVVCPTEIDEQLGMVVATRDILGDITAVNTTDLFDYETVLERDMEAVRTCDHIILLPGWNRSPGAKRELAAALSVGATVLLYNEVLTDARV